MYIFRHGRTRFTMKQWIWWKHSRIALKATYDKLIRDTVPVISIRTEPTYVTIIPKLQQILLYLHLLQNFTL